VAEHFSAEELERLRIASGLGGLRALDAITPEILQATQEAAMKLWKLNVLLRSKDNSVLQRLSYLNGVVLATVAIERDIDLEQV
jgi:hypothetical protein